VSRDVTGAPGREGTGAPDRCATKDARPGEESGEGA
jgi:hypothetical protein